MAARTNQATDFTTLLHNGQVAVATVGFTDPGGNPWLVMNDTAAAVNGVLITNGATGTGPTISVGGANADANAAVTVKGSGTGATILGSSVSAVTLAGAPSISSNLTVTGTVTATGAISASTVTSCTALNASTISASGVPLTIGAGVTSSARVGILFGSSGPTILFGSSVPTSSGLVGSLFLNQGGSSTTMLYVAAPNNGTASSSQWTPFTLA
jgi:hypothetical protein